MSKGWAGAVFGAGAIAASVGGCTLSSEGIGGGGSGGGGSGGIGAEQTCEARADCPDDTECVTHDCAEGVCAPTLAVEGTPVGGGQVPKDCRVLACSASGTVADMPDDRDAPDDLNPCTDDVCNRGEPSHPPVDGPCGNGLVCEDGTCTGCTDASMCPVGDDCNTATCDGRGDCGFMVAPDRTPCGVGNMCAGGVCVECVLAADCPDAPACNQPTCNNNTCGTQPTAAGPLPDPTPGDCQGLACDGLGSSGPVDDNTDVPVDTTPNNCTTPICTSGAPALEPVPDNSMCMLSQMCCSGSCCPAGETCVSGACCAVAAMCGTLCCNIPTEVCCTDGVTCGAPGC